MPTFRLRPSLPYFPCVVLILAAGLGGCGNSTEAESAPESSAPTNTATSSTPSPTTGSVTPSASPEIRVIEVQIVDGAVHAEADRYEVASGEAVRVVVTSDVDDELHVHGVDQTAVLVAGAPTTLDFTVDELGVWDVETHDGGLLLFQLLVR